MIHGEVCYIFYFYKKLFEQHNKKRYINPASPFNNKNNKNNNNVNDCNLPLLCLL